MNNMSGSIFGQQFNQGQSSPTGGFPPTTPEDVLTHLREFAAWVPMTPIANGIVVAAAGMIQHLHNTNKQISEDPFLKMRKFAEEMLRLIGVPEEIVQGRQKAIFFYDYPNNQVYLGYPGSLANELPPIVMKATLGVEAVEAVDLDEAIKATQTVCDTIQRRVFDTLIQKDPAPAPVAEKSTLDWTFLITIQDSPLESDFGADFVSAVQAFSPMYGHGTYQEFRDKFNLSHILNNPKRATHAVNVFSIDRELHWNWELLKTEK